MEILLELISTGKYLVNRSLAWGTSGNISVREGENMIVTASGTFMDQLSESDFVTCSIETGEWLGNQKPSREIPMHMGIYQRREDAKIIIHSSPFFTTLLASCYEPIPSDLFVETMYYLESIGVADYYHPGSKLLGDAVSEKAEENHIILLRNHGVILFDNNFKDAIMRLETLEMAAKMIIHAKLAGLSIRSIPNEIVAEFREKGVYKPTTLI